MAETSALSVPREASIARERNFIKSAVCELRFPTLLQYEKSDPVELQKRLRSAYPYYEKQASVSVGPGPVENVNEYHFRSRKRQWLVTFKASSIALETERYTSSQSFFAQLELVVEAAKSVIDSDFFTRVGLRYVDAVPLPDRQVNGWINPLLVKPLTDGFFGTVDRYYQEVRGKAESGGYSFRHGIFRQPGSGHPEYILDFDFFEEDVEVDETMSLVRKFHEESYSLFHWALGEQALAAMGKPLNPAL
jgi:uncharacterized protein (TIGR04255 family)